MQYLISSCLNFLKNDNKFHLILGSQMIDPQFLSLYGPISNIQTLRLTCIKEWDLGERSGETHQSRGHQGTWADGR